MEAINSVGGFIRHLMPAGSNGPGVNTTTDWSQFPIWPPDLFAVAGLLVERSGCYTYLVEPAPSSGAKGEFEQIAFLNRVSERNKLRKLGGQLRDGEFSECDKLLGEYWLALIDCEESISAVGEWCAYALRLMIVADEASAGIGFPSEESWVQVAFSVLAQQQRDYSAAPIGDSTSIQQVDTLASICQFVSSDSVCVQPKTRTPIVGCTTRSLSRHLALLPPMGEVRTKWHVYPTPAKYQRKFNILAVPYPYSISGRSFSATPSEKLRKWQEGRTDKPAHGYFSLSQDWLPSEDNGTVTPEEFWLFLSGLLKNAKREVDEVDAIVLPELALDEKTYNYCSEKLRGESHEGVGFFISGVLQDVYGYPTNLARTSVYVPDRNEEDAGSEALVFHATQHKHHRWKLDAEQIQAYSIGDRLDPSIDWWEDTHLSQRHLAFFAYRQGSCFTTLICEDLARVDPCQSVIRSIGPNLVFALLMDGPQTNRRWEIRHESS